MRLQKIDSIMFRVRDLEKAATFYEKTLGLKKAWTDLENGMIGFVFPQSDSEIVIHNHPEFPNPDFSFLVENVEKFCKEFRRNGGNVMKEPFDVRTGKFAVIQDLDKNPIPIIDLTKFGGRPKYD